MKMILSNYENDLVFDNTYINTIEILNKKAFYQFLKSINNLNEQNDILFMENNELINISSKISILYDYINFDFHNKKITTNILNLINNNIDEKNKDEIHKIYKKLKYIYSKLTNSIDLNLKIQEDFIIEDISKLMKPEIITNEKLLDNLLLLIDLQSELKIDKLIVFVNLKDYITENELLEFYKYAIYKNILILLIDNKQHSTNNFEKKLLIDEDLIEFVL